MDSINNYVLLPTVKKQENMSSKLNYSFGSISQLGKKQTYNTDSMVEFAIPGGHVFVVCDGHNGTEGHGALAAKLTSDSIKKYFNNKTYKDFINAITNAVTYANHIVFEQSQKEAKYANIGSTLAMVIFHNNNVYYAYAGDSRIYLQTEGKFQPLTIDHVQDRDKPSESEVLVLVGRNKDIKFGVCKSPILVHEGDKLLLCSDGLTDVLSNENISIILNDEDTSPEHKALLLSQMVDQNNGGDNVSIQIIEFDNNIPVPSNGEATKGFRTLLIGAVIAFLIAFGGFKAYQYMVNKTPDTNQSEEEIVEKVQPKNIETEEEKPQDEVVEQEVDQDVDEAVYDENEVEVPEPQQSNEVKPEVKVQPKSEVKVQPKPAQTKSTPRAETSVGQVYYDHKVQYGENLYRIALRYKVTQQQLIEVNGDRAKNMIAGSILKIPVRAVHVVGKGESYSVISDKYNIKIDIICEVNKLDRTQPLSAGKTLVIPLSSK